MDNPGVFTLGDLAVTTAGTQIGDGTTTVVEDLDGMAECDVFFRFQYGSGGTKIQVFFQTSFDEGQTWIDLYCFEATTASVTKAVTINPNGSIVTPTDGALADNTLSSALVLGDRVRMKTVVTGTYAGSTVLSGRISAR